MVSVKRRGEGVRGSLELASVLRIKFILVRRASLGPEHEDQKALGTQDLKS